MASVRWQQRLGDFDKALGRLEEGLAQDSFDDLEKDGIIQRFEFTFELAWKTLKDFLEDQGHTDTGSPKKVLQKAFQLHLLGDSQEAWASMLEDRNRMSHVYDQKVSGVIFQNIQELYARLLRELCTALQQEIS